ncbi:MAG: hypothetical protein RDU13_08335 [Elusimicrobiales bacterium]|jgi:hypothetical protein|nr:hypothetical protein [Elusimicrobiales bacterium]
MTCAKRFSASAALAALVLAGLAGSASACSCADLPTLEERFARDAAIFIGEVTASEWVTKRERVVTLRVLKAWKGVEGGTVTVTTGGFVAGCGVMFSEGQAFLVYASGAEGGLSTSVCSGTRRYYRPEDTPDQEKGLNDTARKYHERRLPALRAAQEKELAALDALVSAPSWKKGASKDGKKRKKNP